MAPLPIFDLTCLPVVVPKVGVVTKIVYILLFLLSAHQSLSLSNILITALPCSRVGIEIVLNACICCNCMCSLRVIVCVCTVRFVKTLVFLVTEHIFFCLCVPTDIFGCFFSICSTYCQWHLTDLKFFD